MAEHDRKPRTLATANYSNALLSQRTFPWTLCLVFHLKNWSCISCTPWFGLLLLFCLFVCFFWGEELFIYFVHSTVLQKICCTTNWAGFVPMQGYWDPLLILFKLMLTWVVHYIANSDLTLLIIDNGKLVMSIQLPCLCRFPADRSIVYEFRLEFQKENRLMKQLMSSQWVNVEGPTEVPDKLNGYYGDTRMWS